jgi:hypothetical protein
MMHHACAHRDLSLFSHRTLPKPIPMCFGTFMLLMPGIGMLDGLEKAIETDLTHRLFCLDEVAL